MGAHEFDNVLLAVSGSAVPGGTLSIETTGTDGLAAFLFVAVASGEICHPFFGGLFIDVFEAEANELGCSHHWEAPSSD